MKNFRRFASLAGILKIHNLFKRKYLVYSMFEFLATPIGQEVISILVLVWGITWELLAMWKAAKKSHWPWFILLFLVGLFSYISLPFTIAGTFGAVAILYFFVFSRFKFEKNKLIFETWKNKNKKKDAKKK